MNIPLEKRDRVIEMLSEIINKKVTVKQLQQLCGYLNFLSKAIVPGQTFTRCMYAKYSSFTSFGKIQAHSDMLSNDLKLKQHHHIRTDIEFKLDCSIWLRFLSEEFECAVCRPMVDFRNNHDNSEEAGFYSDASVAKKLGFGAILKFR